MGQWLLNLPVAWMAVIILVATYVVTVMIYLSVNALAAGERGRAFKGVSPGMLPPMSVVFALLVGFLAAQDWSDTDRANTAVNREASALRATVLLANALPVDAGTRLQELVRQQIQDAVDREWPAMSRGDASVTIIPGPLQEALRLTLAIEPQAAGQAIAQREVVAALQTALDARRQRIILSRSSVDWVKWMALLTQAFLMLLTIAIVHSDNRATNRLILTIFATGAGAAIVLIAAHSRPFTGSMAVTPAVLLQVMPEASEVKR
jgi:hypothetical protein